MQRSQYEMGAIQSRDFRPHEAIDSYSKEKLVFYLPKNPTCAQFYAAVETHPHRYPGTVTLTHRFGIPMPRDDTPVSDYGTKYFHVEPPDDISEREDEVLERLREALRGDANFVYAELGITQQALRRNEHCRYGVVLVFRDERRAYETLMRLPFRVWHVRLETYVCDGIPVYVDRDLCDVPTNVDRDI